MTNFRSTGERNQTGDEGKIEVLVFTPLVRVGNDGGSAVDAHVTNLAENMNRYDVDVSVLCSGDASSDMYQTISTVGSGLFFHLTALIIATVLAAVRLYRNPPDVIYTRNGYYVVSVSILSYVFGVPFVIEVNGLLFEELRQKRADGMSSINYHKHRLIRSVTAYCYRYADHIVTVTAELETALVDKYGFDTDRITVVPNGVDTDEFSPGSPCRETLGLEADSTYVCFVGNFSPLHEIGRILDSCAPLIEEYDDLRLLMVGDGVLRSSLEEQAVELGIADRVEFTGRVPHNTVPDYINASDICIVYKAQVGSGWSPIKLYEYMACGRPVVAGRANGLEVVEEGGAGLLVEHGETAELSAGIRALLEDPDLRDEMGDRARTIAVEQFDWEHLAGEVFEACRTAIQSSAPK